ncbi:MAG TPA: hypothetical protein VLB00_04380 [Gemmatimonadales bacterium]|nr:hypothetical protein [Gemmatimonadales bacterium]
MPARPTALVALSYVVLFLGAAGLGILLARSLAPGSWPAEVVGSFALPVAFAIGLQLWFGLALLSVIPRLLRREPGIRPVAPKAGLFGGFVFLPLSSVAGAVAGVVTGILSRVHPVWWVALLWWGVGTLHGLLAWRLARTGYLVPPESI